MTTTREVWRIDRAGSLDRLTKRSESLPPPARGEVRVRVGAVGLNLADVFACLGLYSATPEGPFIPGLEFAGVIEEVGPPPAMEGAADVGADLRSGDPVFGVTRFGAYATAINAPRHLLAPVPAGWDAAQAAAFPVQGLTAWYGLVELARVRRGELVLLQSAAGGVGLGALAILDFIGARAVATVGHEDKRRFLIDHRGLPPDLVIVRDRRRFGAQLGSALAAARADGFDVVFDALSGPFLEPAFSRLLPRGRLVVYGAADFMPATGGLADPRLLVRYLRRPRIDPLSLMSQNRSVMGFNLIWLWDHAARLPEAYSVLHSMCAQPPLVSRRFSFDEVPAALRFLKSGRSLGKVVIEIRGQGFPATSH